MREYFDNDFTEQMENETLSDIPNDYDTIEQVLNCKHISKFLFLIFLGMKYKGKKMEKNAKRSLGEIKQTLYELKIENNKLKKSKVPNCKKQRQL